MHPGLWIGKTGLNAMDTKLSTIANNLANVNTIGYKQNRAVFEDLFYQVQKLPGAQEAENAQLPSGLQLGTGVKTVGTQRMFRIGNPNNTGQPLDIAVDGRGFFNLLMPDGSIGYTRNGQFHLDAQGRITNANGFPLEPEIIVPENTNLITIGKDGTVTASLQGDEMNAQEIGQITLTDFINPGGLLAVGNNILKETPASGAPIQGIGGTIGFGNIMQNTLELSTVSAVEELVDMISTQRAYEMNTKVVSTSDQMLRNLTQTVG